MGHWLSAEGLRPDPQKVAAVDDMPAPTDVKGVQRLLGMVNYLARSYHIWLMNSTHSESLL